MSDVSTGILLSFIHSCRRHLLAWLCLVLGILKKKICPPLFSIKLFLVLETDTTQRFSQFSVARKTVGVCPRVRSGAEDRKIAFLGDGHGLGPRAGRPTMF